MKTKITVMTLARRRSRFIAGFVFNFLNTTGTHKNTELLIMASDNDDFNKDLYDWIKARPSLPIKLFFEDRKLGKHGRHIFFNELAEKASGQWILHTCDDQRFIYQGWDNYIRSLINTNGLDPDKIHMIIPSFDNTGDVDQMLSKGYIKAMGQVGGYGNIDSWINEVREVMPPNRVHLTPDVLMHDMTPYSEEIYKPEYLAADTSEGDKLPKWKSSEVQADLEAERQKMVEMLEKGW